jgi:hypothetical protein
MFVIYTFGFGRGIFILVYLSHSKNVNRITKETFSSKMLVHFLQFFLWFSTSLEVNEKHRDFVNTNSLKS